MSVSRTNSREKILATALELFSRQGYEKTSVREIARASSLSLGLLYNYFDSKEALLKAIVQQGIEDIRTSFSFARAEKSRLQLLVQHIFTLLEKKKKHWRLLHSIRMQEHLSEILSQEMEQLNNDMISELSLVLRELHYRQPVQEAVLLFATIDGIAHHYLSNDKYPVDKIIQMLVDKYTSVH